ncbi:MAG TPA: hypothetical protein PLI27_01175 [Ignavibacteriales bacterium]|nr:hypothetical protein [Ignavibacteriales bacterium]HOM64579.1 hypothetical protein [Ignavibacteriales bacterium]HPD66676.1 hypothetical protein [Ignavibacteriales bacterium]HRR17544.1 hypothetical protein [Ignavibacteriales bacterium]
MGAVPETVEVQIEIDSKNKKVIATAMGNSELRTKDLRIMDLTSDELLSIVALSFKKDKNFIHLVAKNDFINVFSCHDVKKYLLGMIKTEKNPVRVIDNEGTIKLQLNDAIVKETNVQTIKQEISNIIQQLTTFGDAGALVPDIFIINGAKIIDMTGLVQESQVFAVVDIEVGNLLPSDKLIVIATKKS